MNRIKFPWLDLSRRNEWNSCETTHSCETAFYRTGEEKKPKKWTEIVTFSTKSPRETLSVDKSITFDGIQ